MNLLINFSTLKVGGGQNVAMNFLSKIFEVFLDDVNLFFIVAKNSEPHKYLKEINYKNFIVVSNNPIKRIFFENFESKEILKLWNIDIIYTYFGYGLFPKNYIQVSGVAVSNVFFPEINFWDYYPFHKKFVKKLIDKYRIYGIKKANALIFENKTMENRCKQFKWNYHTTFIKPSIINYKNSKYENSIQWDFIKSDIPKGLFLCGWHLNKNVLIIPKIAKILKNKNIKYKFIITAGNKKGNFIYERFKQLISEYHVNDYIEIIEPVKKSQLKFLYENIQHVFLLSKLESFSNNIIEAWFFEKPLIITDALWSKDICNNAALFVDRDKEESITSGIIKLINDSNFTKSLINEGKKELSTYPTIEQKILLEINFIKEVYEKKS